MDPDGSNQTRLTFTALHDQNPRWSPDGTKITYYLGNGTRHIFVSNADGSNPVQLTSISALNHTPDWSPGGTRIAFQNNADGDAEIFVMNAGDGSDLTQVTNNTATDGGLSWAESVRRIGETDLGGSVSRTIEIQNMGQGDLTVSNVSSNNGQFTISPVSFSVPAGGSQGVMVTFNPTASGTQYATLKIESNDPDDGTINLIINGTGQVPDLRIDGDIAFNSDRDGNLEIYTMSDEGAGVTRRTLNSFDDAHPVWSPDRSQIAFHGQNEIWVMDANGSNLTNLTMNSADDGNPSWSPDGTQIAFTSKRTGNSEVFVMDADGGNARNLTMNSAGDGVPTWSPDGTYIAFVSNRSGNLDIFRMDATDGSGQINLTNSAETDNSPFWSHDGTQIAFARTVGGNDELYVMNIDGTGQTRLTNDPASDTVPTWSADGKRVYFSSDADGDFEIYEMKLDGSNLKNLTDNPARDLTVHQAPFQHIGTVDVGESVDQDMTIENDGQGTLSVSNITSNDGQFTISPSSFNVLPGGNQDVTVTFLPTAAGTQYATLTIESNDPDYGTINVIINGTGQVPDLQIAEKIYFSSNRDGDFEIYKMDADGANQILLTSHSARDDNASVSPDGKQVAFNSDRTGNHEIYVMDMNGSNLAQLTNNGERDDLPAWSPDGTQIVFVSERDGGGDAAKEIYVMDVDGSNQTRLTNNTSIDNSPVWHPDGTVIVFSSSRNGNADIYVMNVDGTNQIPFINHPANDQGPDVSPDGTRLVYFSNRNGNEDIFVANFNGDPPVEIQLVDHPANDYAPVWSPDGTKIAFYSYRDDPNGEIYVMDADGTDLERLTSDSGEDLSPSWGEGLRHIGLTGVGTPVSRPLTVENTGDGTLTVNSIVSSNSQFTASPMSFSVLAGGSQAVNIMFTPTSAGTHYTTLTIASNDPEDGTIALIVNGTANRPPVANAGPDQTVECASALGTPVALDGAGSSDPDNDALTYTWRENGNVIAGPTTDATVDVTLTLGVHSIELTVDDGNGEIDTDTVEITVQDTTPPVITLDGNNPLELACGTAYAEPGASVVDACDPTVTVTISGTIDHETVGSYTVTYTSTDANNNTATETRTVNVTDTDPPVITLTGDDPQTLECSEAYTELGATAADVCDGDLSGSIVIDASAVNVSAPGSYTVTYNVSDAAGNAAAEVIRMVNVVDTTAPVITVLGNDPLIWECGTAFVDPGATVSDICDASPTLTSSNDVDITTPGTYAVTYAASDASGNTSSATRSVEVKDTTPPVVLTQDVIVNLDSDGQGSITAADVDAGSNDACGIASLSVNKTNFTCLDLGPNEVTLTVVDVNGNTASGTASVTVNDVTAPDVTITVDYPDPLECESSAGNEVTLSAVSYDACDDNPTFAWSEDGSPIGTGATIALTFGLGTHTVTVIATDVSNNVSVPKSLTFEIVDTTPPDLLASANPAYLWPPNHKYHTISLTLIATDNCDANVSTFNATVVSSEVSTKELLPHLLWDRFVVPLG